MGHEARIPPSTSFAVLSLKPSCIRTFAAGPSTNLWEGQRSARAARHAWRRTVAAWRHRERAANEPTAATEARRVTWRGERAEGRVIWPGGCSEPLHSSLTLTLVLTEPTPVSRRAPRPPAPPPRPRQRSPPAAVARSRGHALCSRGRMIRVRRSESADPTARGHCRALAGGGSPLPLRPNRGAGLLEAAR